MDAAVSCLQTVRTLAPAEQLDTIRQCIESCSGVQQVRELLQRSNLFSRLCAVIKQSIVADPVLTASAMQLLTSIITMSRDHATLFARRSRAGLDSLNKVLETCASNLAQHANLAQSVIRLLSTVSNVSPSTVLSRCSTSLARVWDAAASAPQPIALELNEDLARLLVSIFSRDDHDGYCARILETGVITVTSCGLITACTRLIATTTASSGAVLRSLGQSVQVFAAALSAIAAASPDTWPLIDLMQSESSICTIMNALLFSVGCGDEALVQAHTSLVVLLGLMEIDAESIPRADVRDMLEHFVRLESCCREIWESPSNDDVVAASLQELAEMLAADSAYSVVAASIPDLIKLLIHCLFNIDERVMIPALNSIYSLLLGCPEAHLQFLNRDGFSALAECLHDYNIAIRVTTLEILSIVAAVQAAHRNMLKSSGILKYIVQLVAQFAHDDDVSVAIVEAAAGVLSLALTENLPNQEFLTEIDSVRILLDTVRVCIDPVSGEGIATTTIEALLLTLNNLLYRNTQAQDDFRRHGGFEIALRLWDDNVHDAHELLHSVLNLIINAIDTCEPNQDSLCAGGEIRSRMEHLLTVDSGVEVCSLGCLLLSHLCWNHPANQALFSTESVVRHLLEHIASGTTSRSAPALHQLSLFALMGLSNLAYQNHELQELVSKLGGMEAVHGALVAATDGAVVVNRVAFGAATTALGNLVNSHPDNGRILCLLGGVDLLLSSITDKDDDEESKRAFLTIVQMGQASTAHMIAVIKQSLSGARWWKRTRRPTAKARRAVSTGWMQRDRGGGGGGGGGCGDVAELIPYLTALNGIIYLSPSIAQSILDSDGFVTILNLLRVESHRQLAGYALFIMVNLTVSHHKSVQARARADGAFDALESCLRWLVSGGVGASGAFSHDEVRRVIYQVLDNLVMSNGVNAGEFLSRAFFIDTLIADCGGDGAPGAAPVLPEAAELLLTLCEQQKASEMIGRARVQPLLERIQQQTTSHIVHAKAQQTLDQIALRS